MGEDSDVKWIHVKNQTPVFISKNMKIKNIRNLGIIALGGILIAIIMVFLLTRQKEEELDSIISQESISQSITSLSNQELSLQGISKWVENEKYYLFEVDNTVQLEKVKQLAEEKDYKLVNTKEGFSYKWEDNGKQIIYDLSTNILTIVGEDILTFNTKDSFTSESFSQLVSKYFDLNWKYELFHTEKGFNGETVYYLKRFIDEKILIEIDNPKQQTDHIALKNGKVIYAKLLLAKFVNTNKITPLVSQAELNTYINQPEYSKSITPDLDILNKEPGYIEIAYVQAEWDKIYRSISNCEADNISVVYLYKKMSQQYLTPVFHIEAQCEIAFKEKEFFVPAVWFVNAIEPSLIISDDSK